jgi:hypothetical protein
MQVNVSWGKGNTAEWAPHLYARIKVCVRSRKDERYSLSFYEHVNVNLSADYVNRYPSPESDKGGFEVDMG